MSPALFFFAKVALAIQDFLWFHTIKELFISVKKKKKKKKTIGILIETALNM